MLIQIRFANGTRQHNAEMVSNIAEEISSKLFRLISPNKTLTGELCDASGEVIGRWTCQTHEATNTPKPRKTQEKNHE